MQGETTVERRGFGRCWITSMSLRSACRDLEGGPWSLPSTLSPGQLRSCSTRRFTFVPDGNGNDGVSKTPSWIYLTIRFPRLATPFSRVAQPFNGDVQLNGRDGERLDIYLHKGARWVISNQRTNERMIRSRWTRSENFREGYHRLSLNISRLILRGEREKNFFFLSWKEEK